MSTIVDDRNAKLQSCILYIYSTNIGTEYFKHGIYSPFFPLQNAVCFIILTYLVSVLFTFYTQGVLKLKKKSGAKRLRLLCLQSQNSIPSRSKKFTTSPKTVNLLRGQPSGYRWLIPRGLLLRCIQKQAAYVKRSTAVRPCNLYYTF